MRIRRRKHTKPRIESISLLRKNKRSENRSHCLPAAAPLSSSGDSFYSDEDDSCYSDGSAWSTGDSSSFDDDDSLSIDSYRPSFSADAEEANPKMLLRPLVVFPKTPPRTTDVISPDATTASDKYDSEQLPLVSSSSSLFGCRLISSTKIEIELNTTTPGATPVVSEAAAVAFERRLISSKKIEVEYLTGHMTSIDGNLQATKKFSLPIFRRGKREEVRSAPPSTSTTEFHQRGLKRHKVLPLELHAPLEPRLSRRIHSNDKIELESLDCFNAPLERRMISNNKIEIEYILS